MKINGVLRQSAAIFAAALLSVTAGTTAFAATTTTTTQPSLVSLGDSITFGYNLTPGNLKPSTKAFPYLIGQALHASVTDLGVPGATSSDLLTKLATSTVKTDLASASYVTIDIGSNDILQPALKDGLISPLNPSPTLTPQEQTQFLFAEAKFATNLSSILSQVKADAPKAKIVLYNIYNPIPSQYAQMRQVADQLIQVENAAIITEAGIANVPVVNAYQAFNGKTATYVLPNDVHPTVLGQKALATIGLNALQGSGSPAPSTGSTGNTGSGTSTGNPSVSQTATLAAGLKAIAAWPIAPAYKTAMANAYKQSVIAPYLQETMNENVLVAPVFASNPLVAPLLKSIVPMMTNHTTMSMKLMEEQQAGHAVASNTIITHTGQQANKVMEYIDGSKVYVNQGSGWQLISNSSQVKGIENAVSSSSTQMGLVGLQQVTVTPSGNGFVLKGSYGTAQSGPFIEKIFSSLLGNSTQLTASQLAQVGKSVKVDVTLTVVKKNGSYQFSMQQTKLQFAMPASMLPSVEAQIAKMVPALSKVWQGYRVTNQIQTSFAFNPIHVVTPSGLPSIG